MRKSSIARLTWATPEQQRVIYLGLRYFSDMEHERSKGGSSAMTSYLTFVKRYISYDEIPEFVKSSGYTDVDKAMWFFDNILSTHGVEHIVGKYWTSEKLQTTIAHYCNTGEAYAPTLVARYDTSRRFWVMSLGDLVETLERKGMILS
jgi:hypothetical protein